MGLVFSICSSGFCLESLKKTKTHLWMAGVPAGIQSEDFPNKALQSLVELCLTYPTLY